MSVRVSVRVRGDRELSAALRRAAARNEDMAPAMRMVNEHWEHESAERFAQGGGHGVRWKPLAPSTVRRKKSSKILVESGALERSLTGVAPGKIREAHRHSARYGTAVHYAKYHHGGNGVPRRRIVAVTRIDRTTVTNIVVHWVMSQGWFGREIRRIT